MIKTYENIQPDNRQLSFDIKRMEDIYAAHQGQADVPHRHDYYIVLLVTHARGQHLIDFQAYELGERQVYFISPGQVHQLIEQEASRGWAITFNRIFMVKNHIDECFISDINLFRDHGQSPPLALDIATYQELEAFVQQMEDSHLRQHKFSYQAIGAYLTLFLIHCNQACSLPRKQDPQQQQTGTALLRQFKTLVDNHHTREHQVSFYASELAITTDHLNRTVKALTGYSAKSYIQARLLVAARRLLYFSDKTAKEIGYELGFQDPAYFSSFFKKASGISVSAFRESK